ncbi:MAG: hypothetical protein PHF79_00340 [Candidatus Pacebacteria bacterium]|nr:hypothetical protein [Candidatus Paceibacterota bacterium]
MATKQQIPVLAGAIVSKQEGFEALSNDDVQWAIENTEAAIALSVVAIKDRNKTPISSPIQKRTLTPWKTIKVGGMSKKKLAESVKDESSDYAKGIMGKPAFSVAEKEEDVDLIDLTPRDLGFTANPRTDEFMTKEFCAEWSAKRLDGYVIELCSPEDGPQLRRQYQDQPNSEVVWMAMERISDSDGDPLVFSVERSDDGHRWLCGRWSYPGRRWVLGIRIVFRLRKIAKP